MQLQSGESLLDCLYEPLNGECMYLSDLRWPRLWAEERCALVRFSPMDFRPGGWTEALRRRVGAVLTVCPPPALHTGLPRRRPHMGGVVCLGPSVTKLQKQMPRSQ